MFTNEHYEVLALFCAEQLEQGSMSLECYRNLVSLLKKDNDRFNVLLFDKIVTLAREKRKLSVRELLLASDTPEQWKLIERKALDYESALCIQYNLESNGVYACRIERVDSEKTKFRITGLKQKE